MKQDDPQLTDKAVKYATEYFNAQWAGANDFEKSIVINSTAHGHYMGAAFAKNNHMKKRRLCGVIVGRTKWTNELLMSEAENAGKEYLRQKHYIKLENNTKMLVRACVVKGFTEGFRSEFGEL